MGKVGGKKVKSRGSGGSLGDSGEAEKEVEGKGI